MNDWKIEIIIRLLQIIDSYESGATSANDDDSLKDEVAILKAKVFGDPYPPKN